jgi:hypothetical protein
MFADFGRWLFAQNALGIVAAILATVLIWLTLVVLIARGCDALVQLVRRHLNAKLEAMGYPPNMLPYGPDVEEDEL